MGWLNRGGRESGEAKGGKKGKWINRVCTQQRGVEIKREGGGIKQRREEKENGIFYTRDSQYIYIYRIPI